MKNDLVNEVKDRIRQIKREAISIAEVEMELSKMTQLNPNYKLTKLDLEETKYNHDQAISEIKEFFAEIPNLIKEFNPEVVTSAPKILKNKRK